jgi:hypothetical protein
MSGLSQQLEERGSLIAGLTTGGIGLVISFALKGIVPARPLGDPVPLMLAASAIPRGFTYFPWRPALFHLLFAVALGLLATVIMWVVKGRPVTRREATIAGRIAAVVNIAVVAILAVDAFIVAIWYLIAGAASILITGYAAGLLAAIWRNDR